MPAIHRKYVENMIGMFGDSTLHGITTLEKAADFGATVEMENYFSRLALDIIGKAVFNYDFDSLTHDDPVIRVRGLPRRLKGGIAMGLKEREGRSGCHATGTGMGKREMVDERK